MWRTGTTDGHTQAAAAEAARAVREGRELLVQARSGWQMLLEEQRWASPAGRTFRKEAEGATSLVGAAVDTADGWVIELDAAANGAL